MNRKQVVSATVFSIFFVSSASYAAMSSDEAADLWADVDEATLQLSGERLIVPRRYRTVRLDWVGLGAALQAAPLEGSNAAATVATVVSLPLPDGGLGRFRVEESPVMAPELAAKFPEIKTYRGIGIDDPSARLRFDTTPAGFHAMVQSPAGSIFVDPYARDETEVYVSYFKRDYLPTKGRSFECHVGGGHPDRPERLAPLPLPEGVPTPQAPSGATRRVVDLAVAATGEYTTFHGGTVVLGQAAIVTAINRINMIYENELALFYVLVANNNLLVNTNAATDPYGNECVGSELDANQTYIDNVIGQADYDLGHVFTDGGGGLAGPGPCDLGFHAAGCTGVFPPTGDPFWVDFVAHEMGHQWSAPHTFNGSTGSCTDNREASAAWEPGSGTTIMSYAGICAPQNVQVNSDDYFHGASIDTIEAFDPTDGGFFAYCLDDTATGNNLPVANAGANFTIPRNTPFTLCGSATDGDPDALTYAWEEFDLGPQGPPGNANTTTAPIFRSFAPTSSPCRTFPQLSDILTGTQTMGEILPNVGRTMSFRLRARDNRAGGGGTDDDAMVLTVDGGSGPFRVTSPNTAVTWTGNSTQTVTWDVAGTDIAPVSCANVDIFFSSDGGLTFPTLVLAGTENHDHHDITVPNIQTTMARLKIQCSDNVFFDVSDVNFIVIPSCSKGQPDTLNLNTSQSGTQHHTACSKITVQNGFSMQAGANVTLQAGVEVIFENGSAAGNDLSVVLAVP